MIVGFTGTRDGMTGAQSDSVSRFLVALNGIFKIRSARHGMCVGADAQFHDLIRLLFPEAAIVGHPPTDLSLTDRGRPCDKYETQESYLARNRSIVHRSHVIIAAPKEMVEQPRGGTWSTFRYAVKMGKLHKLVMPDGSYVGMEER